MVSRRDFLRSSAWGLAAAVGAGVACGSPQAQQQSRPSGAQGRVIILGFDGVEPSIVEAMLAAGELPSLAKLKQQGSYQRLGSSNPPQSPTAWSSFITCKKPGNHGIYDFLRRNPATYIPGLGFGRTEKPKLGPDGRLSHRPAFKNFRQGEPFWVAANRQGIRCKLLNVPYGYPPDRLKDSVMLSGLEIPDLRGTQSTFFALSELFEEKESLAGGMRLPLRFEGDSATVSVPGFRHPDTRDFIDAPMTIKADRAAHKATITVQGAAQTVAQGGWSDWFEWTFNVTAAYAVKAISRVHAFEVGDKVRLYMTCLQYHPKQPYVSISAPEGYAAEIADRAGLYPTVGWTYDTKSMQRDEMTEDAFIDYANQVMAWREALTLDELDRGGFDLLISGWTVTDRIAHMFWRFRDKQHLLYTKEGAKQYGRAIEDNYARMDAIVGKVMAKLKEGDLLIVMSDHGFHSFRTSFSINTWLVRNGYLAVEGQSDPATAFTETKYLQGFDWARTKAYALGLGGVYLNLKGREGQGAVATDEAPALLAELKAKLLAVTDPDTGAKVFSAIYTKDEVYAPGVADADAPDIQLGYADGYQTAKISAAGAAPADIFSPNDDKWSGEHAAADVAITPGILFSSAALASNPAIIDLGPTALKYLGVHAPADYEGKALV